MTAIVLVFLISISSPAFAQERNADERRDQGTVDKRATPDKPADDKDDNEPLAVIVVPFRMLLSILPQLDRQR